jgi:NAD(P)-dependent dehydrogenase (short-subunit alcohol dehydrogenase family)
MTPALTGKIALITGANSGIGLATAKLFASEGAYVFITGRRQAELDAAVREVGPNVTAIRGDVSNLQDLDHMFDVVRAKADRLDVLFANAGLGEFVILEAITEAHYAKTFDVNVKGTLFTVQKALPLMSRGGSIIVTGSTAAVSGAPGFSVYSASKAAVRALVRNWILDLKGRNIRINVLVPGSTSTPGLHALTATPEQDRQFTDMLIASVPLGRIGLPDEIANAALFLASDASSFVNGSELYVDGGQAQV